MGFMYSWGNIKRVLLSVAKLLVCDRVATRKGTIIMSVKLILRYGPERQKPADFGEFRFLV